MTYEEFVQQYKLDAKAISMMEEMLPYHMHGGIKRYFNDGVPPGHFLRAVLAGDLHEAVARADEANLARLPAYSRWLYNYVPGRPNGWGSYEAVDNWLRVKNEMLSV